MFDSEKFREKTKQYSNFINQAKSNKKLSEEEFKFLINECSSTHPILAARNDITPGLLDYIENKSSNLKTLIAIANNPLTSRETLEKLWRKNIRHVNQAILNHPNGIGYFKKWWV